MTTKLYRRLIWSLCHVLGQYKQIEMNSASYWEIFHACKVMKRSISHFKIAKRVNWLFNYRDYSFFPYWSDLWSSFILHLIRKYFAILFVNRRTCLPLIMFVIGHCQWLKTVLEYKLTCWRCKLYYNSKNVI